MISRLLVSNFQAHKKIDLKFEEGVNCIVGPTDSGKSSIFRALTFALQNIPKGDFFIRTGADKTLVKVKINGHIVSRSRGKGENLYKLGKKEFRAFNKDVPDSIAEIVNMTEINFQGQHDRHFWIAESDAEVNRQLNKIVNLQIIDKTLSKATQLINKLRTKKEVLEESIQEKEDFLEEFAWIEDLNDALEQCIEDHNTIVEMEEEQEDLEEFFKSIVELEAQIDLMPNFDMSEYFKKVDDLSEEIESMNSELSKFEDLVSDIEEYEREFVILEKELTSAEKAFHKIHSGTCPLCGK